MMLQSFSTWKSFFTTSDDGVCEFIYICCSFRFCHVFRPGNFQGKRIKHTTNDELEWIWKWHTPYTHNGKIHKCTKNSSLNNPWFSLSSFACFFYYQCSTIFIAHRMLNMLCWNDVSVKSTSEQKKKTFKMFIFFVSVWEETDCVKYQ